MPWLRGKNTKIHTSSKMWPAFFLLCITFCITSGIKIEISGSLTPAEYNCDHVDLEQAKFITCVCFQGVWAFWVLTPGKSQGRWDVIGGNNCLYLGRWVRHMYRLSSDITTSKVITVKNRTTFVLNHDDWEVDTVIGKVCLQGAVKQSYCRYDKLKGKLKNPTPDCSTDSQLVMPNECERFLPAKREKAGKYWATCSLMKDVDDDVHGDEVDNSAQILRRVKRAEGDPAGAPPPASAPAAEPAAERNITAELDEEYIGPDMRPKYKGDPNMMEAITDIMLKKISGILGFETSRKKRYATDVPPVTLLRVCAAIFQKICSVIKPEMLHVALEAFLQVQKTIYLIKEPYIGYSQYERILRSLERCENHSSPFEFFQNDTNQINETIVCERQIPNITSAFMFDTKVGPNDIGYIRHTREIPDYAASDPNLHEPVTELMWKMFVNTHAYCYRYFRAYFNDHHTFTVTLMPYFTNPIQDIWYSNGTNFTSASNSSGWLNYTTEIIFYGNLFGNLSRVYFDLDHCYSASRTTFNEYPWFMNRPPRDLTNEWLRRKRAVEIFQAPCANSTSADVIAQAQNNPIDKGEESGSNSLPKEVLRH